MSHHPTDDQTTPATPAHDVAVGRRKLLRLGAGAAPILMALGSRSVFACHSTTPSAFGSVCNSRPEILQSSNGRSPGYWKNHPESWPTPYFAEDVVANKKVKIKASTFQDVFCSTGGGNPFSSKTTLLEALESGGGGSKAVARACISALLNARSGRTPSTILSADNVINIWTQYSSVGYFEPIAGIKWYADSPYLPVVAGADTGNKGGIIGYLNTTWT